MISVYTKFNSNQQNFCITHSCKSSLWQRPSFLSSICRNKLTLNSTYSVDKLLHITIIIIIIQRQRLRCCHHDRAIVRVHSVHLMNVERRQDAADPQTKPNDLGCESACTGFQSLHSPSPFTIITQPESWYSFTIPQRVEGWVDLVEWLHTETVYLPTDGHPSWY